MSSMLAVHVSDSDAGDPVDETNTPAPETSEECSEPTWREWIDSQPTRETWLMEAAFSVLVPMFESAGVVVPPFKVSCGWTGAGIEGCTLGVCYPPESSSAGTTEIFISPTLDNALDVVCVLAHELVHATVGTAHDHDADHFGLLCTRLGITQAGRDGRGVFPGQAYPSETLRKWLAIELAAKHSTPYPHASLIPPPPSAPIIVAGNGPGDGPTLPPPPPPKPTQTTRLLKATCPSCGYIIRVTMKWASRGLPRCSCTDAGTMFALDVAE